jgi:hypothetical protein
MQAPPSSGSQGTVEQQVQEIEGLRGYCPPVQHGHVAS